MTSMVDRDELAKENDMQFMSKLDLSLQAQEEHDLINSFEYCGRVPCCWRCHQAFDNTPGVVVLVNAGGTIHVLYYCRRCYENRSQLIKNVTLADFMF